jgi:hypothetical protein
MADRRKAKRELESGGGENVTEEELEDERNFFDVYTGTFIGAGTFSASHGYGAYQKYKQYRDKRQTEFIRRLRAENNLAELEKFKSKPVTYSKTDIKRLRSGIGGRVGRGSGRLAKAGDTMATAARKIRTSRAGRALSKGAKVGTKVAKTILKAAPAIGPVMVLATHYDKPPIHVQPGFDEQVRGQMFDYKRAMMEIKPAMVALEIAVTAATIALGALGLAGVILAIIVSVLEISMYAAEAALEEQGGIDWSNPIDYITLAEQAYARDKYEKWKADVLAGRDSKYSMQARQWYHFEQSFDQEGFEELKQKVTDGELTQKELDILEEMSFATPGEALDIALQLDDETFAKLAPLIQTQFHFQQQMTEQNPDNYKMTDAEFEQIKRELRGDFGVPSLSTNIDAIVNEPVIAELEQYHAGNIEFEDLSPKAQQVIKDNMQRKNKTNTVKPGQVQIGSYEIYLNQQEADIYNAWLRGDMEPLKNASPATQEKFRKVGVTVDAPIIDQASSTDAMAMAKHFEQISIDYEEMGLDRYERRTGRDYSHLEADAEQFLDYLERRKNSVTNEDKINANIQMLESQGYKFPQDMDPSDIEKMAGNMEKLMDAQGTAYGDWDYNWDEMYDKLVDLDDLWDTRMRDFQEYRRQEQMFTADYERSGKAAFGGGTDYNVEYTRAGVAGLAGGNPTGAQISRKRARFS